MKKGRQNKKGKIEYRKSEPKVIRVNLSLVIGIIVVILILCTSFVGHKMSIISTKVLSNLVEEVTDEDDTWKIVNMSESEEEIENVSESYDSEIVATSSYNYVNIELYQLYPWETVDEATLITSGTFTETLMLSSITDAPESYYYWECSTFSTEPMGQGTQFDIDTYYTLEEFLVVADKDTLILYSAYETTYTTQWYTYEEYGEWDSDVLSTSSSTVQNGNDLELVIDWTDYWPQTSGAGSNSHYFCSYTNGEISHLYLSASSSFDNDLTIDVIDQIDYSVDTSSYTTTVALPNSVTKYVGEESSGESYFYVKAVLSTNDDWSIALVTQNNSQGVTVYIDSVNTVETDWDELMWYFPDDGFTFYYEGHNDVYISGLEENTWYTCVATLGGTYSWLTYTALSAGNWYSMEACVGLLAWNSVDESKLTVAEVYTIEFDGNGSDSGEMDSITTTLSKEVTLSTNEFTREGYTFTGWNTEADGTGTSYEDGATVSNLTTEDGATVTLYAQWEPITYKIMYYFYWDTTRSVAQTVTYTYDEEYTFKTNTFTKTGYTFVNWNTESDGTGTSYEEGETFTNLTSTDGDIIYLYAQWDPITYTITFDGNSGSGSMENIEATYDEEYTLTANAFTRTGYTFTGWNTESDGTGTTYEDGATVSNLTTTDGETVTLYAQWILITYSIEFDGNGATSGSTESMTDLQYDTSYTLTMNGYEKTGYTFTGWSTEADGSGTSYEDGATVSNLTLEDGATVTLYAQWEQITVSITITKVSSDGETTLEGVEFSLYELICEDSSHDHDSDDDLIDTDGYDTTCWELFGTYTTGSDGIFTLSNLPITGIYRLVETKTVDDYLLPSGQWSIKFDDLDEDETITVDDVSLQITGISNPPAMTAGDDTIYIYNYTSYDIPTTGAVGITQILAIGAIIILIGLIDIMHKKKV